MTDKIKEVKIKATKKEAERGYTCEVIFYKNGSMAFVDDGFGETQFVYFYPSQVAKLLKLLRKK